MTEIVGGRYFFLVKEKLDVGEGDLVGDAFL